MNNITTLGSQQKLAAGASAGDKETLAMQSAKLLFQQQMLEKIEQELELKRREHDQRMQVCAERRKQLQERRQQFQERKLKFDKFLKENEAKRQKAVLKTSTERKLLDQKKTEVQLIEEQIAAMKARLEETAKISSKWAKYRDFLIRLVQYQERLQGLQRESEQLTPESGGSPTDEVNNPLNNSSDKSAAGSEEATAAANAQMERLNQANLVKIVEIISRYATLKDTNEQLNSNLTDLTRQMDQYRQKISTVRTQAASKLVKMTAEQSSMQNQLENAITNVGSLKSKLDECSTRGVFKMRELSEMILAIDNLYGKSFTTLKSNLVTDKIGVTASSAVSTPKQTSSGDTNGGTSSTSAPTDSEKETTQQSTTETTQSANRGRNNIHVDMSVSLEEKIGTVRDCFTDLSQVVARTKKLIKREKAHAKPTRRSSISSNGGAEAANSADTPSNVKVSASGSFGSLNGSQSLNGSVSSLGQSFNSSMMNSSSVMQQSTLSGRSVAF